MRMSDKGKERELFTTTPSSTPPISHNVKVESSADLTPPVIPNATAGSLAPPQPVTVPPGMLDPMSLLIAALANPQQNQEVLKALSIIDSSANATPNPDLVQLLGAIFTNAIAAPQSSSAPTIPSVSAPADRKSTRLNSSHSGESRMPSSA